MGAQVYTIETVLPLLKEAHKVLKILDNQLQCFHGDGTLGLPSHAPYDAIIVTAGAPEVPKNLIDQLKVNGRLVIPIGDKPDSQTMFRFIKKEDGTLGKESFGPFRFVPLKGKEGWN
jgi:protein-L-isoaspartate(D-aspartate) O-methyltransferase